MRETLFLKVVVFLLGLPILALCIYAFPVLFKEPAGDYWMLKPILVAMYVTAIPYFLALFQTFKLLTYIDKNIAFSELSVQALKKIKFCAIFISAVYALIIPFFYFLAQIEDAPGIVIIGMFFVFAPTVIAVFAAVLQKLLKVAIDIKSENDLTI